MKASLLQNVRTQLEKELVAKPLPENELLEMMETVDNIRLMLDNHVAAVEDLSRAQEIDAFFRIANGV